VFEVFDWIMGILFVAEALVKIGCFGYKYLLEAWNYIDMLVVLAFLIDKVASSVMPVRKQTIQLLRLFRLVRLVRLIRTLEGLDVLYIMTTAIRGMNKILVWAVVLLTIMLMTCALFLTQSLHAFYFSQGSLDSLTPAQLDVRRRLYEYFGTFTRCLLSMFELTLANWPPVTRLLAEELTEWFMLICIVHKLTIGFAVIGVINGVIMQETFKVAATDDTLMVRQKRRAGEMMRKKMSALFEALDHSQDGALTFDEFEIITHVPEVKTWLASMEVETDDLHVLFNLIDDDNNGSISIDELVSRVPRIKGAARSVDLLALIKRLHGTVGFLPPLTALASSISSDSLE
jgi:hypothetical protein